MKSPDNFPEFVIIMTAVSLILLSGYSILSEIFISQNFWIALGAIATSLAVILALQKDFIREKINQPKLQIFWQSHLGGEHETAGIIGSQTFDNEGRGKWLRIKVKNEGKTVARNCICVAHAIRFIQFSDWFVQDFLASNFREQAITRLENSFATWYLHWLGNENPNLPPPARLLGQESRRVDCTRNIYPDEEILCDVVTIGPAHLGAAANYLNNLGFIVESNQWGWAVVWLVSPELAKGQPPILPPGRYELELRVYGENCKMARGFFEFEYDPLNLGTISWDNIPAVLERFKGISFRNATSYQSSRHRHLLTVTAERHAVIR